MQKVNIYPTLLFKALLSTVVLISCKKSKDTVVDQRSPAVYISKSENLAIPAAVEIPANAPNGNSRVATYYAEGLQRYKAQAKPGTLPVVYEWVFIAPLANLYDATNTLVGTHSAGPTWQLSAMDSIYGQQFTPARTAPGADPNSIDWLLLMPKAGKTPTGIFANVSYIQRIATVGGKAPATAPTSATETADVPYTAIYRFTKKNP